MGIGFLSDLEEKVEVRPTDNGDHDLFAHYILKENMMSAYIEGAAVMALCGKVWVPTRDGTKFPVCPECKDIYEQIVPA